MSFHDVLFPEGISFGSISGPCYNTQIIVSDSGAEERISRWENPLHRMNARFGIKTRAQMAELRRFFWARRGAAHSFRVKDWVDYTTAEDGVSTSAFSDQQIAIGDGSTSVFQLTKAYTNGGVSRIRNIKLPVSGTVAIGVNGSAVGSGWSLNYATGVLTFTSPPTLGHAITWGGQFHNHMRFGKELDQHFAVSLDAFDTNSLPDIPLVEVVEDTAISGEFYFGGAAALTSADNLSIAFTSGRVQTFNFTASGKSATLPDPASLPLGGPYMVISNVGANTFTLKKHDGTTVRTVAVPDVFTLWLGTDGSNPIWICV